MGSGQAHLTIMYIFIGFEVPPLIISVLYYTIAGLLPDAHALVCVYQLIILLLYSLLTQYRLLSCSMHICLKLISYLNLFIRFAKNKKFSILAKDSPRHLLINYDFRIIYDLHKGSQKALVDIISQITLLETF